MYGLSEQKCFSKCRIDLHNSNLVEDQTEAVQQIKAKSFGARAYEVNLSIRNSYKFFCRPAILSIKELLNKQLGIIQAKVVQQAWAYSIKDEIGIPTFVVPSAPVAPVEITTAIGEGFDEDEFPLATAIALEDRNERFDV